MNRIFVLFFLVLSVSLYQAAPLAAQSATQLQQIQQELTKRGLSEAEVRTRLIQKGIILDEIPPAELPQYQERIMAVIEELEAEKNAAVAANRVIVEDVRDTTDTDDEPTVAEAAAEAAQRVVMEAVEEVNIYGHGLFTNQSLDVFRTTDGARAPDTYILGAGDQIRVTIFGTSQADLLLEINTEGFVQPAGVPKIFLQGLTLVQARSLMQQRLSSFYTFRSDQFALTIQTARTITINVFGESNLKGSFTVSALNTALNALAAAGGPTRIGSVRDIQVIRGSTRKKLDVYAFMNNPSVMFQFDLQHNDIIYVPIAEKLVRIDGAVRRPMRYELTGSEDLRDLIRFAGGINFNAYPDYIQVERLENDEVVLREWKLTDVLEGKVKVAMRDGDVVRVRTAGRPLEQFVDVRGSVFYDGRYDLNTNRSLRTLFERAQLTPQAKTDLVFVERVQLDETVRIIPVRWDELQARGEDFTLQIRDRVSIFDRERYADQAAITVQGNVRNPFTRSLPFDERLTLANALAFAGGLQPTAAEVGYVFRTDLFNPDIVTHIRVDLVQDWDFELQPGDRLNVYNRTLYSDIGFVNISGAVNNPFRTQYDPNLSVSDLLTMAGGFTREASLSRVDIFRLNLSLRQGTSFERITLETDSLYNIIRAPEGFRLQPFDQIVVREIPMYDIQRNVQLSGEVMYPGVYPLESRVVYLSDIIEEASGLTPMADPQHITLIRAFENTGPVVVDLANALRYRRNDRHDPILMEGDVITMPKFKNTVGIRMYATRLGQLIREDVADVDRSVFSTNDVLFQGPKSAGWYIKNFAGGFSDEADRRSVTVTDRSGQVRGTRRVLFFFHNYPRVEAGSTIALREKIEPLPGEEKSIDWDMVFNRTMQTTTTLLTMLILIDRL